MAGISSLRSRKVYPVNPPVWVERIAVGKMSQVTPDAEMIGRATVREHFPTQEISLIASTLILKPQSKRILNNNEKIIYIRGKFVKLLKARYDFLEFALHWVVNMVKWNGLWKKKKKIFIHLSVVQQVG